MPGIQWNYGEDFGGIHVFLGIKSWNTAVVFIETGGRAVMDSLKPGAEREYHQNRRPSLTEYRAKKKYESVSFETLL